VERFDLSSDGLEDENNFFLFLISVTLIFIHQSIMKINQSIMKINQSVSQSVNQSVNDRENGSNKEEKFWTYF